MLREFLLSQLSLADLLWLPYGKVHRADILSEVLDGSTLDLEISCINCYKTSPSLSCFKTVCSYGKESK